MPPHFAQRPRLLTSGPDRPFSYLGNSSKLSTFPNSTPSFAAPVTLPLSLSPAKKKSIVLCLGALKTMSSTDHPEPGASSLKEHDSGSATSPQGGQPQIDHPEPTTSLSEKPAAIESDSTAVLSSQSQSDSTAVPDHPAGGERVAPVTATTSTTTTPANETTSAPVAQPTTKSPAMETEEPKLGVESSEQEQSDEGKEDGGPSLDITLLLTTGSRHPFTIDGKYLRKRSVNVENHDPFAMSVYTLKELIWREWRSGELLYEPNK